MRLADKGLDPTLMSLAYVIVYPFGVIGIILVLLLLKNFLRIDIKGQQAIHNRLKLFNPEGLVAINLQVNNSLLFHQPVKTLSTLVNEPFVVSGILRNRVSILPLAETFMYLKAE